MTAPLALAVDIGGTKIAAGLVDEQGRVQRQVRRPTGSPLDADAQFEVVVEALAELDWRGDAPVVCGVGCGGPMSDAGATVSPVNIEVWRDFPLRDRLARLTGLDVFVDNDAKALALAEGWCGGAAGRSDFLAMVVSTGVGGGIVVDGRLLDGADGNAGHIGHVVVEPEGHRCGCGAQGCLEAEASGTAIERITGRPARDADASTIERTGTLVGRAVASVANLLDLQLALVAGSVALGFGEPFFTAAQAEIAKRARLPYSASTQIAPAGLGAQGPLVGAAAVGWRGTGRPVGVR